MVNLLYLPSRCEDNFRNYLKTRELNEDDLSRQHDQSALELLLKHLHNNRVSLVALVYFKQLFPGQASSLCLVTLLY